MGVEGIVPNRNVTRHWERLGTLLALELGSRSQKAKYPLGAHQRPVWAELS